MKDTAGLTQAERIRIKDLAKEIIQNKNDSPKYQELVNKISVFVEGVKVGVDSMTATNLATDGNK